MFDNEQRIFTIAPQNLVSILTEMRDAYGVEFQGSLTIAAHWDDFERTRKRAASLNTGTVSGIPLTNGRLGFMALWVSSLMEEFDENGIEGVEEITLEQLRNLIPQVGI